MKTVRYMHPDHENATEYVCVGYPDKVDWQKPATFILINNTGASGSIVLTHDQWKDFVKEVDQYFREFAQLASVVVMKELDDT